LEARGFPFIGDEEREAWQFPFIRFTNWKQGQTYRPHCSRDDVVSIHTLHELEASLELLAAHTAIKGFHSYASRIGSKILLIAVVVFKLQIRFHSYASRIGSKLATSFRVNHIPPVSIHTLHELEARNGTIFYLGLFYVWFPFIRFTNWKQETTKQKEGKLSFHSYASRIGSKSKNK